MARVSNLAKFNETRQQERTKPCVLKCVISDDVKYLTSKLRRYKVKRYFSNRKYHAVCIVNPHSASNVNSPLNENQNKRKQ